MATDKNENTALQTMLEPNWKETNNWNPARIFAEYRRSLTLPAGLLTALKYISLSAVFHGQWNIRI